MIDTTRAVRAEGLLKSLSSALGLVAQYKATHPSSIAALQKTLDFLRALCVETGMAELTLECRQGRWYFDGQALSAGPGAMDALFKAFKFHDIQTLTFSARAQLFEVAAFCELLTAPSYAFLGNEADDFLKKKGVVHILLAAARGSTSPSAAESSESESSRAAPSISGAKLSLFSRLKGRSLGSFIKILVEESVTDTAERVRIYGEVFKTVQSSLQRKLAQATQSLREDKQRIQNEKVRAESLLSNMGEGRVIVDKEGNVLMMDPAAEEIVGRRVADVAGKPILDQAEGLEQVLALSTELKTPSDRAISRDINVVADAEVLNAVRHSTALVHDEKGQVVGTFSIPPYVAQLREAMKVKDEFISHVTHELKAPLTALCSSLEVLSAKGTYKLDCQENRFLEIGLKNARLLTEMINKVLDLSRIETGRLSVKPVSTALHPILSDAVDQMRSKADAAGLSLEFDAEGWARQARVIADHGRIVQVLTNLLSNAVKFTARGGRIRISAAEGQGESWGKAVIRVTDTGRGIAGENHELIFQRYTQVPDALHPAREGMGLGLAIVKELVERHRGGVTVDSEPGRGSSFAFTLPLSE